MFLDPLPIQDGEQDSDDDIQSTTGSVNDEDMTKELEEHIDVIERPIKKSKTSNIKRKEQIVISDDNINQEDDDDNQSVISTSSGYPNKRSRPIRDAAKLADISIHSIVSPVKRNISTSSRPKTQAKATSSSSNSKSKVVSNAYDNTFKDRNGSGLYIGCKVRVSVFKEHGMITDIYPDVSVVNIHYDGFEQIYGMIC